MVYLKSGDIEKSIKQVFRLFDEMATSGLGGHNFLNHQIVLLNPVFIFGLNFSELQKLTRHHFHRARMHQMMQKTLVTLQSICAFQASHYHPFFLHQPPQSIH